VLAPLKTSSDRAAGLRFWAFPSPPNPVDRRVPGGAIRGYGYTLPPRQECQMPNNMFDPCYPPEGTRVVVVPVNRVEEFDSKQPSANTALQYLSRQGHSGRAVPLQAAFIDMAGTATAFSPSAKFIRIINQIPGADRQALIRGGRARPSRAEEEPQPLQPSRPPSRTATRAARQWRAHPERGRRERGRRSRPGGHRMRSRARRKTAMLTLIECEHHHADASSCRGRASWNIRMHISSNITYHDDVPRSLT